MPSNGSFLFELFARSWTVMICDSHDRDFRKPCWAFTKIPCMSRFLLQFHVLCAPWSYSILVLVILVCSLMVYYDLPSWIKAWSMHLSRLLVLGPDVVRPGKLKLELVLTLRVTDLICCLILLPCLDLRLIRGFFNSILGVLLFVRGQGMLWDT